MSASSVLFAVRIDQHVKNLVATMAHDDALTESRFIERLVREKARSRKVPMDDSWMALMELEEEVQKFLDKVRSTADEHITRSVFDHIQHTARLRELYERAIRPPAFSDIRPEKRRQFVHQRLGRFVKEYLQLHSLGEVLLPAESGDLIRGYTRLGLGK